MTYVLSLDQGTTSSRAILIDAAGRAVRTAQQEFRQIFPQSGWVEHVANEIWQSQLAVARDALQAAKPGDQVLLALTNQRETTVLWDRASGEPIAPAIVWQDRRTASACDALRERGHAPRIAARTGLVIDAYFSATKLQWLLDHVPQARRRAERGELAFGTIDSWLLFKLTGGAVHATEPSNASRTMLFNIHTLAWTRPCCGCSTCQPACCRRCCRPAAFSAIPTRVCSADRFRSWVSRVTSRPPPSARPALRRGWPRTPTAPAASC